MSEVIDLSLKRKMFKNKKTSILNDFSLTVNEGEKVAIMGKSGVGKTSLLNILGLVDNEYEGSLKLFNETVDSFSESKKAALRNENIGFVLQESSLIESLKVEKNIKLPLLYASKERRVKAEQYFDKISDEIGITNVLDHLPSECSGGQKARVTFLRGIIMKPDIILSDEPTAFLDEKNKNIILDVLFDLNKQYNTTLITVTHDEEVALRHDRVIYIENEV